MDMIPWMDSWLFRQVDVWDPNSPVTGCEGNGETALISFATWIPWPDGMGELGTPRAGWFWSHLEMDDN